MRIKQRSYGLLVVICVVMTATALSAIQSPSGSRKVVTSAITPEEIDRHIRFLASDEMKGRLTGSPEEKKAAEYIASDYRTYGLQPVGDNNTYYQTFPFVAGVKIGQKNSLVTTIHGKTRPWRVKKDFVPMTFSTQELARGEIAFVGFGISAPDIGYDDYEGVDVNGKIVLVLRFSPEGDNPHGKFDRHTSFRAKALMARQHGAKAIAFIADTDEFSTNKLSQMEFDNSFSDSGIVAVAVSRQLAGALVVTSGLPLDALQKKITQTQKPNSQILPNVSATLQMDLIKDTQQAVNVVGYVEGDDPTLRAELIIIGAHYDHLGLGGPNSLAPKQYGEVHNGADDNASGTAGLLELAQFFGMRREGLKRSLLFIAFSGEEEGVLGSSYYTKHPIFPLERTVAMINMDMIGRLKENKLNVQGVGTSPAWSSLLEELNQKAQFDLTTTADGAGPSDHRSFYVKDIPVLFFFTGTHSDYHKPSDDYDKINSEGEAKVVRFVYEVVSRIQDMPVRPQFSKTQTPEHSGGRRGFSVGLGIMPDYSEEAEGVKITGAREGSPAEKAGLIAGDVIIRLGDTKLKNIYDYMYALGDLKAGQEVEVEVLREGKSIVMKVTPEKRN